MKRFKKSICGILICVLSLVMSACAVPTVNTSIGKDDPSKFERLTWWTISNGGLTPNDFRDVELEMNKIFKSEINAEVTFKFINTNDFSSGMQTKINGGENFDICYTSNWCNDYLQNVGKSAFYEITDDDLTNYAPVIKATFDEEVWKAVAVNGKKYAVINNQLIARGSAIRIRKEILDPYAASIGKTAQQVIASIKTIDDYTPILAWVKKQSPALTSKDNFIAPPISVPDLMYAADLDALGSYDVPGAVKFTDSKLKVVNQYDTDSLKNIIKTIGSWNAAGYYPKDMISESLDPTNALMLHSTTNPAIEKDIAGKPIYIAPLGDEYWSTGAIQATMNAISTTSKNPARSLKALNLMYSNKKLFNLFAYGIENTHYKLEDGKVKNMPSAEWTISSSFAMGNDLNRMLTTTQPNNLWENVQKINDEAKKSTAIGFVFDPTNVEMQVQNCRTVIQTNITTVLYGILREGETHTQLIDRFVASLKTAGSEAIVAEMQKQLDAWNASNAN